jgi:alpha-glucosidase (family GH31 glycosyl hydrolase)
MMNLATKHLNYLSSLILAGFIPGQVDAVPAETTTVAAREHIEKIVSKNYNLHITIPGFRVGVTTSKGVALPADTMSGLSFLGAPMVSSEKLRQVGNTTSYKVTNQKGDTALVEVVAKAHTIEIDVALEKGKSGEIRLRTATPGAAYGLGDRGGYEPNANLASIQKTYEMRPQGTRGASRIRWTSSFLIFPEQGVAGAFFQRRNGTVDIGPEYYQMTNKSAASQKFYYYIGSMEEIYAAYRQTRIAEGFPGVPPKMDGFELGFETWDLLKWKTSDATVRKAIDGFLKRGYPIRWAVTGSGFWQAAGTTTSFGLYDYTKFPDSDGKNPPDLGDWLASKKIRWMIGQRTNFIPLGGPFTDKSPGESGARTFDTSPYTQEGLDKNYFLREENGELYTETSKIFPTVDCYILDGNIPGAAAWFKKLYDQWGVDGVKEDTMLFPADHTTFNATMRALAEDGNLVMARHGAYSSPGTLTRINDTHGRKNMSLRAPINYLQFAASAAPNVYSDTVGFKHMEDFKSAMRIAWMQALTAGMAVSDSPWNSKWSKKNEAAFKKSIDFHYALGPYLYSCAVDSHITGYPHTMTPMPIAYPDDARTQNLASEKHRQFQWMIGPSLLAAPLLHDKYNETSRMDIYLPAGKWIDLETGDTHYGPTMLKDFDMPIDKTPVFVGGKGVYVSRVDETSPLKAVVYPVANGGSSYTFHHLVGGDSTIINNNTGWTQIHSL